MLRIGTRGSPLALWQARAVEQAIRAAGGPACELTVIRTTGDRLTQRDLSESGGKRLFVKEIEEALLDGGIQLAVHSAKDLPAELPPGLIIGAALPREDPRDAVVLPLGRSANGGAADGGGALLAALGAEARVGTGSVRRVAQLARAAPQARFESIRGNVGTRLRKLDAGDCEALVLAAAGLVRLGLGARVTARLTPDECLPAPGQGIVAIEVRESDARTRAVLAAVHDRAAGVALAAERALVQTLGGDCRLPLGALAVPQGDGVALDAVVASLDGRHMLRRQASAPAQDAAALGRDLAARLLADGAGNILAPHRPAAAGRQPPGAARPQPLAGKRILVTRPRAQAADLVDRLRDLGAEPVEAPVIRIAPPEDYGPLDAACAAAASFDWIVFTSVNGVDAFMRRLAQGGRDTRALGGAKLCAIGPATAARLRRHGLEADVVPEEHRAEALFDALRRAAPLAGARVLLARADIARAVLAESLRAAGADVTEATAYRTVLADGWRGPELLERLRARPVDVVTFTSASTVRNFVEILGAEPAAALLRSTRVAAIGPITAAAAEALGIETAIMPATYTIPALVDAIAEHFA